MLIFKFEAELWDMDLDPGTLKNADPDLKPGIETLFELAQWSGVSGWTGSGVERGGTGLQHQALQHGG